MKTKLGDYNTLTITRFTESGAYLDGGDGLEILMPKQYTTHAMHPGSEVKVFVYLDQQNRPVATTETPLCRVGEFACLEVSWLNEYGAFLNWGLLKDLFVPFSQQRVKMVKGHSYVVYVYIDERSGRITASSRIGQFLSHSKPDLKERQEVSILVHRRTQLGYKAIILNTKSEGLLYKDEVFRHLDIGDRLTAYVHHIRPDGKIDLSLQLGGRAHVEDFAVALLHSLQDKPNHFIPLTDASAPDEIYDYYGVSKKTFKRAVGALYKEHLIALEDEGIRLL